MYRNETGMDKLYLPDEVRYNQKKIFFQGAFARK